jgi:hypothetical protein
MVKVVKQKSMTKNIYISIQREYYICEELSSRLKLKIFFTNSLLKSFKLHAISLEKKV